MSTKFVYVREITCLHTVKNKPCSFFLPYLCVLQDLFVLPAAPPRGGPPAVLTVKVANGFLDVVLVDPVGKRLAAVVNVLANVRNDLFDTKNNYSGIKFEFEFASLR